MASKEKKGILLESGTNELELVEVYIDEVGGYRGYYGVNVAKVIEMIELPANITKPPQSAPFVNGVFNHRGRVITLIDLGTWLNKTRMEGGRPIVVITEFNETLASFLVSGVTRIHRTSWSNINPVSPYLQGCCDAMTGVIHLEGRTVLILDLESAIVGIDPSLSVPFLDSKVRAQLVAKSAVGEGRGPLRVLHADDSGMIRRMTKQFLEEDKGFLVTSVVDGSSAWDCLLSLKEKATAQKKPITDFIDMVLSDIEMPQMDGYHLCLKTKADAVLKTLPFVLFSSLITDKLRHKGESVGADAQISKPNPAELIQQLKGLWADWHPSA